VSKRLKNFRKGIIRTFFSSSFNRDILILLIVSVAIGAALSGLVAMSANSYFSEAISSLVGEYGEFDVLINVREEMKEDGRAQIEKIVEQVFPGGKLKEGPTITGLTSFLVGLPAVYKNKQTYETLSTTFGSVPGRSGVSIMTEPRITIKGVPEGARNSLIDQIMPINGVLFAFRDGGSVTVIIKSLDQSSTVRSEIAKLLSQYNIIDIAFPVGSEPENPIRLGEQIADAVRQEKGAGYAESVSVASNSNDTAHMASSMMELKRFLTAFATRIAIVPAAGMGFISGDIIALQGSAAQSPAAGQVPDAKNILVQITSVANDSSAQGMIIQGTGTELASSNQAYLVTNNNVGALAGTVTFQNPRQQLGDALNETSKLVLQIPGLAQDAQNMTSVATNVLNNYNTSLSTAEQTLSNLEQAGSTIQAATSGLANLDTTDVQVQLGNSSRALGSLVTTLQVVRVLNPDVGNSIADLTSTRQSLDTLQGTMQSLDRVAADARQARTAINSIVANGNSAVSNLRAFDVIGARKTLTDTGGRLAKLQEFNTPMVAAQLQYLGTAVPNLRDDEISSSIKLLDQFIAGQVIPSQRIQILTYSNVTTEFVAPVIYRIVGHNNLSLYSSALGIIEPDPRAEVMVILTQVKAILAGMVSLIALVLFLVLDHTAIMTFIRRNRLVTDRPKVKGWRRWIRGINNLFTAPECLYGMGIGALMLTVMFVLSGGGIPYVPWLGVPVLGAAIGLLVANNAEKISPLELDEVTAGESLGLSFDEVMREIVIPNGRPGLLQKLNRRKMKFK
jgi:prefoldin subunit 5